MTDIRKLLRTIRHTVKKLGLGARKFIILQIQPIASKTAFLSRFYYFALSSSFADEQFAVLAGINTFRRNHGTVADSSYILRRNIHRLEKGLIMKPRKDVFAHKYIEETVAALQRAVANLRDCVMCDREVSWATDVLREYFRVTDRSNPNIGQSRAVFEALDLPRTAATNIPYRRSATDKPAITIGDLQRLAEYRRSVRWFEQRPVPRILIDEAVKVALQSPSACNRQAFRYLIFDEPFDVLDVSQVPGGASGFNHNIPAIAVVIGRMSAYFDERDRHAVYVDAGFATMALLFGLETQGLSSCVLNWPDVRRKNRELERLMDLEPTERCLMMIAIGYPDFNAMVPSSLKKDIDNFRVYCTIRRQNASKSQRQDRA